jgi:hypothetical protein
MFFTEAFSSYCVPLNLLVEMESIENVALKYQGFKISSLANTFKFTLLSFLLLKYKKKPLPLS